MVGEAFIVGTANDIEDIMKNNDSGEFVRIGIIPDILADYLFDKMVNNKILRYEFTSARFGVWMKGFTKRELLEFFNEILSAHPHHHESFSKDTSETIKLIEQLDERKKYLLLVGEKYMVCPVVSGLCSRQTRRLKANNRLYELNMESCYLRFYCEQGRMISISFDVEKADDYHYEIEANQLRKLCKYLKCGKSEEAIVAALNKQMEKWTDPIEIAALCKDAGVKHQCHSWY